MRLACENKQHKRIDFELDAVVDVYGLRSSSLLSILALRDKDQLHARTRIELGVHHRFLLSLVILARRGVSPACSSLHGAAIFFVQKNVSPRTILQFGAHAPRPIDMRVPSALQESVSAPLTAALRAHFNALAMPLLSIPDGVYCCCPAERMCE